MLTLPLALNPNPNLREPLLAVGAQCIEAGVRGALLVEGDKGDAWVRVRVGVRVGVRVRVRVRVRLRVRVRALLKGSLTPTPTPNQARRCGSSRGTSYYHTRSLRRRWALL